MRIALGLEYDGCAFRGWQSQAGGGTVQDALEAALAAIAETPLRAVCAGRTDAGVHALMQVVHVDTDVARPESAWVRGVNAHLPVSVAVRWAMEVPDSFHARFSATARRYRYLLLNRPERPALLAGKVGWFHRPLDVEAMGQAAAYLQGEHDFSAFRAADCQAKSPVKIVRSVSISRENDLIAIDIEANAFLYHMVRNIVGSLVFVGKGLKAPDWIGELLAARERHLAAPTFSPDGLYLASISYDSSFNLPMKSVNSLFEAWGGANV
ncbi:MAG: tRNA pseudouridine(38-40) synthase TruA [Rhodocyclaceae bacterium]|nr:tRNA pseudouridine(38-40) synthase TruA [Rhodocyclaceae bacterium]